MEKNRRTRGALPGVTALALFTLGTETLPDRLSAAGSGAWLCPLAAGAAGWLALRLLVPLARRLPHRPGPDRGLWALFLAWGLVVTAAQANRVGLRLSEDLRGSPLLLTAVLLALSAWMASGGLEALGRACRIFTLAVGLAFGCIVLFALGGLRWDWLVLFAGPDLAAVPRGAGVTAGTLSVGLFALVLGEEDGTGEEKVLRRGFLLLPLLALATLLVTGRLGPALAASIHRPFFQMVSGLGFQGAFQRLEELVSALWLLGDLALLALLLLCLGRLTARVLPGREGKAAVWVLAGLALVLAGSQPVPWPGWRAELAAGGALLLFAGKNLRFLKKGVDK